MPADSARPWSPVEAIERVPELIEQIHDAVSELHPLARAKAAARWRYEKQRAKATLKAEGGNSEIRRANALLTEVDPEGDGNTMTVAYLGYLADIAADAHSDQKRVIDTLSDELSVIQTMISAHKKAVGDR